MDEEQLFKSIHQEAMARGISPAELSMDAIAAATGVSRSSLYRRFGSRQGLNAAMAAYGFDVGIRSAAEDRLIAAAHTLIVERGVQALTLESVAETAGVALPTVYALFRNRARLMRAVFTHFSPIPLMVDSLPDELPGDGDGFRQMIEAAYQRLWDFLEEQRPLIVAIIAEVVRDPESVVMDWLRTEYLPQVSGMVFPIMTRAMDEGLIERAHPVTTAQSFIAPILMYMLTQSLLTERGIALPDRDQTCAEFAYRFCRATLVKDK